jgi:hypothetical protein
MNRFVLITSRQKLILCLTAVLFIVLSAFFISIFDFTKASEKTTSKVNASISPEKENKQLKDILSNIVPSDNNILFENNFREISDTDTSSYSDNISPAEIILKGKVLPYIFAYSDEDYLRPIYSSTWKQGYNEGWLYLPRKVISARHCLFAYTGESVKIFDLEGELGFYPNISIDNQNYLNLLIYNFDLNNIYQLSNQIIISGTPVKKGVQIISIRLDDIAAQTAQSDFLSIQLCTPSGYEIDYQNIRLSNNSDNTVDYGNVEETGSESNSNTKEVSKQNILLRQELSYYISDSAKPIYFQHNGSYQTSDVLDTNLDLAEAINCSVNTKYKLLYNNQDYKSPVFHPQWKEHYDREWCYIPRKMYLNMKKLFVLPSDKDVSNDLCGELGFFGKYADVGKNQAGFLITNFSVSNISIFEDNIFLTGTPSRDGLQIVSITKTNLTEYPEYAVRLVTKDSCELDVDVLKN